MCSTENHEQGICYDTTAYGAAIKTQTMTYSSASSPMSSYSSGGLERIVGNYQ